MIVATAGIPSFPSFHRPRLRPGGLPRRAVLIRRSVSSSSSASSWEEREEARWLREEQRWLREEQRWLREEARWRAEREALLAEIAALRLRLGAVEAGPLPLPSVDAVVASPAPVPAVAAVPPPAPPARPPLAVEEEVEVRKEVVVVEEKKATAKSGGDGGGRRTLRVGAEGEDVRAMQEALEKLGYYSGEEDMEFSSFSSGTERAVKTWQATLGISENGIMTSDLLDRLLTGQAGQDVKTKDDINGAAIPSVTEIAEIQQTVVKGNGVSGVGLSENRVFLIGENRWEDPSRLTQKNKSIRSATNASTKKCISCRGEGRLMCVECDGTGEPNIEPQFLEWVGEDTKCPYCEGLGSIVCDVCEGKTVATN
uniref:Peptidoglycan binding-like domain-containing protein n=1 Tax=Oryza punctata TaxID=4537 RepID=A0A0E0KST3_ORYPU